MSSYFSVQLDWQWQMLKIHMYRLSEIDILISHSLYLDIDHRAEVHIWFSILCCQMISLHTAWSKKIWIHSIVAHIILYILLCKFVLSLFYLLGLATSKRLPSSWPPIFYNNLTFYARCLIHLTRLWTGTNYTLVILESNMNSPWTDQTIHWT